MKGFLIPFTILAAPVFAQPSTIFPNGTEPPVFYHDNFEGDPEWVTSHFFSRWWSNIERGVYYFELYPEFPFGNTRKDIYLDEHRDYSISARFHQTTLDSVRGYFLSWGGSPGSESRFSFAANGRFYFSSPDEQHSGYKKPALWNNTLKIEHHAGRIHFFINDEEVYETSSPKWSGWWFGFGGQGVKQLEVDDYIIHGYAAPEFETLKEYLPQNLGGNVNTKYGELYPHVSLDGKTIYYIRQLADDNPHGKEDGGDVWITTSEDGVNWTPKVNAGPQINTSNPDLLVSVSSDNNTLVFIDKTGFYLKHRTADDDQGNTQWSPPERLGTEFESRGLFIAGSLAPNGRALLFSAKLKQNLSFDSSKFNFNTDLFVSLKDGSGNWLQPINLGADINTNQSEDGPILAADGRTLYFSKAGSNGDNDLFMSKRLGEGWTSWTKPVELNHLVNCFGSDNYLSVPACGDYAYYCSRRGGLGENDLYRIKLADSLKPDPVVLWKGKILHAITRQPLAATVLIDDLTRNEVIAEGRSNPTHGDFMAALPYGTTYGLHASAVGYLPLHENLDLTVPGDCKTVNRDLLMMPAIAGQGIVLNNVFFYQSRAELKPESFLELDRLADLLMINDQIEIELSGHTDNVGNSKALKKLSDDRVTSVKNYLVSKGISSARISGRGYGPDKPVAKNDTEENRSKNRRVEFIIVKE